MKEQKEQAAGKIVRVEAPLLEYTQEGCTDAPFHPYVDPSGLPGCFSVVKQQQQHRTVGGVGSEPYRPGLHSPHRPLLPCSLGPISPWHGAAFPSPVDLQLVPPSATSLTGLL